jgi:two-component system, sensor histidine kinase and response regulator
MDGLALAGAIRTDPSLAGTRLLLLTSGGLRGDARAASEAGIAAYLTKPVRERELHECLLRLLAPAEEPPANLVTRHALKDEARARRPRILVAEDNAVNQKIAALVLEKLGYRADIVANGSEAVEAFGRTSYDGVLMDCQMPEMDGYEATAEIRRREGDRSRIPIIAMTAGAMTGDRERCLAAGMDDYVAKPVRPDHLSAALRRWVGSPDLVVPRETGE